MVFLRFSLGAVWNTCKVEVNSSVAVFGLGAVVSSSRGEAALIVDEPGMLISLHAGLSSSSGCKDGWSIKNHCD